MISTQEKLSSQDEATYDIFEIDNQIMKNGEYTHQ